VIYNLVHSSNQQIKEEVGRLMIAREAGKEGFLELQKIKGDYDEFVVNFQEEPTKSQR
jgi:hypothetical protein